MILELIQGEAGVQPLGADYVKFVRELCDINHALLIIDEVQTGIGRTGKWFAFQRDVSVRRRDAGYGDFSPRVWQADSRWAA